ncbi:MAG: hypothetical protein U0414_21865 [Polyangiaceae bacterium]
MRENPPKGKGVTQAQKDEHARHLKSLETSTEHSAALAYLNKLLPGTTDRLGELYTFSGRRSFQLWGLPAFINRQPLAMIPPKQKKVLAALSKDSIAQVPKVGGVEDRLMELQIEAHRLKFTVKLHHSVGYADPDGNEGRVEDYFDLRGHVDCSYKTPLLVIPASSQLSRKAGFVLLDWLVGSQVDRKKGPAQQGVLRNVTFQESHVVQLAKKLKLDQVTMDGIDPSGDVGELTLKGKNVKGVRDPLDLTKPIVQRQDSSKNRERTFNFPHVHSADNYRELAEVTFVLHKAAHIRFERAASTDAISTVVKNIYLSTGGS